MDDEPTGAAGEDGPGAGADRPATTPPANGGLGHGGSPSGIDDGRATADPPVLAWDDDLPLALGEETDVVDWRHDDDQPAAAAAPAAAEEDEVAGSRATAETDLDDGAVEAPAGHDGFGFDEGDDLGDLSDDQVGGRRNALPPRVESWRTRSATGAIATALAMGLQQVFEPEKRRPAAVAEAPSDPYSDDDPVTVDYLPDDAEGTTVHVKPWLLQKGDPA